MNSLALLALLLPAQTGTLDQTCPMNNAWFNAGVGSLTWQIEIATGIAGTLEGFDIELQGATGATVDLDVIVGGGWNLGAPAWSGTLATAGTGTWEPMFVDVSSAGITLNAGDLWVIQVNGNAGVGIRGEYVAPPGTPPYPQPLYLNAPGCFADCGWRIGFNTYMLTGPSGPLLTKFGTCPGAIRLTFTNATPNGSVAVLYGAAGTFVKPTNPCMGLTLNIASPTLAGVIPMNAVGTGSLSFNAPAGACGRTVQGVDLATCLPSNPIVL
jgi:hypothetical protein